MSKLDKYIKDVHGGKSDWFVEEVLMQENSKRINNILLVKDYLAGKHSILNREIIEWKGKKIKSSAIVLQYTKPILTFQTSFLFKNPVTLISEDKDTLLAMQNVYKTGNYNDLDYKIAEVLNKIGQVFEYNYIDKGVIKGKILKAEECYPILDEETGEYIALLQYYTISSNSVSYYTIFTEDKVIKYDNKNDVLHFRGEYKNLSGLPVMYMETQEDDDTMPHSDVEDYVDIIDNMESLISKYFDSFYKFLNPIPVMTGTKLNIGAKGEGAVNKDIVGNVLQLDDGSTFNMVLGNMDVNSLKGLHDILMKHLLNISMTPSISMSASDISNLAEESIRMMYTLPIMKAVLKSRLLKEGFRQRWEQIKKLLKWLDTDVEGVVDCNFEFAIPSNSEQVVKDIVMLKENGLIDLESALEQLPYIYDVNKTKEGISNTVGA